MTWKHYTLIIAALLLIAAIVWLWKRPVTEADLRKAEANAAAAQFNANEWKSKYDVASLIVETANSKLLVARDSIRILYTRNVHLRQSVSVTADVRVDTVRDTVINNVPQDVPVIAGTVVLPRKGTVDSTDISWIDKIAVRASIAGIEVTANDVRFSTEDFQTIITEHVSPWYWVGAGVGMLLTYVVGTMK